MSDTQLFTIVVNFRPQLGTSDMPEICTGQSFNLNSINLVDTNNVAGPITYHSGTPATPGNQLPSTTVSPTTTTTYYILKVGNLSPQCSDELAVTVVVNPVPTPSFVNPQLTVCENATGIVYSLDSTYSNHTWNIAGATVISGGTSVDSFVVVDFGTSNATISVTVGDINTCTAVASANVTVIPHPTATITGLASMYCPNDGSVLITGSPLPGGGATGVFSINGGGTITDHGNGTATFDPSAQGVTTGTASF